MANLKDTEWEQFPLDADPKDKVSKNFRFYELTRSEIADRRGIDNHFSRASFCHAAVWLCRSILQPIRDSFGKMTPNSVYRGQALERALKGRPDSWSSKSQHTRGQACDVEITGFSTLKLATWVTENLDYDQVICECYDPRKGPNSGWVHVSILPPGTGENRFMKLSYIRDPDSGGFVYVEGLQASL